MNLHEDEIQIDGRMAYPLIDGKAIPYVAWYKIDPDKVTIGITKSLKEEETREYDIKRLTLSGFQVDQSSKDLPKSDKP